MAAFSLYACSSALHRLPSFPLHSFSSSTDVGISADDKLKTRFVVLSAHSNPRILKFSNKSTFRRTISPYDIYDEEEDEEEFDDDNYPVATDDWLMNDDFAEVAEFDVNGKTYRSQKRNKKEGKFKQKEQYHASNRLKSSRVAFEDQDKLKATGGNSAVRKGSLVNPYHASSKVKEIGSLNLEGNRKVVPNTRPENKYQSLSDEIDFDRKWIPLLDYLSTFGLKESHFVQMYERHMPSLQISVCSAEERLEYLISVGVKHRDIKRILLRQPQILEYTVENNLKPHVAFLKGLGIPNSGMGQIIAAAPSLFSYSVENSLKPTVRYLIEEVGINENNLGKVVKLSPQILVQRIDISWNTRYLFLSKELGAPRDSVVKMVTKHPQLLHYSIDDGLLPRINFLRSIGMHDDDILKVLTSLTQVLSLSLENNLKPKYEYLINELNNEVHSLTKYPMYLSLSLDQRIRPRHQFLVALKKAPKGPFPLSSFVPTDECFCQQWAGTSLDSYLAFRQRLLLKNFAKKYEKRGY